MGHRAGPPRRHPRRRSGHGGAGNRSTSKLCRTARWRRGTGEGAAIDGSPVGAALAGVPRTDRRPNGRGSWCVLGRDRRRGRHLECARLSHTDRSGTLRSAVAPGARSARGGAGARGRGPDLPVGAHRLSPAGAGAWRMLLRRLGIDATVQGFCISLRDWCGETRVPREWPRRVSLTRSATRRRLRTLDPPSWKVHAQSWRRGPSAADKVDLRSESWIVVRRIPQARSDWRVHEPVGRPMSQRRPFRNPGGCRTAVPRRTHGGEMVPTLRLSALDSPSHPISSAPFYLKLRHPTVLVCRHIDDRHMVQI